jgi:Tfp pilus assembly protein PilZ
MVTNCPRVMWMPQEGKPRENTAGSRGLIVAAGHASTDSSDSHGEVRLQGSGLVERPPDQREKRDCPRHNHRAALIFSIFNRDKHYQAHMFNCSQGGMYFEADHEMRPGTSLYLRVVRNLTDFREETSSWVFRTVALGQVKWCHQLTKAGSARYGIGVSYYPDLA